MSEADFNGVIDFPPEWKTAAWNEAEILQVLTIKKTGRKIILAGGVLEDGSCLYGLNFVGGQRVTRISPATNWAVEERFKGQPKRADRSAVESTWRMYVQSLVKSKHEAERELGPPPVTQPGDTP